MARSTSKKTEYEARAEEAMKARKALVGAIGDAESKYDKQLAAVTEAQRKLDELALAVAAAYDNAVEGGWTAGELKQLNITRLDAKPSKPAKKLTTKPADSDKPAAPQSNNGASAEHHEQAPHAGPATSTTPEPALSTGGTPS
jgi:hypothetical protein